MKRLYLEIKNWKLGWKKYLKYSWASTLFLSKTAVNETIKSFKNNINFWIRFFITLLGMCLGLFADFIAVGLIEINSLSNFLVSVGVMAGGAIAIVFTISIFLLQNSVDLYSSQFFQDYIQNRKEKMIYVSMTFISLVFLMSGLFIKKVEQLTYFYQSLIYIFSGLGISFVFVLLDMQYKNVLSKINPIKTINFLEKEGLKFLKKMETNARWVSKTIQVINPDLSKDELMGKTYNTFFSKHHNNFDRQIENIIEISLRLADKRENEASKTGFLAVQRLLIQFIELRKNSTYVFPSSQVLLATESDNQSFIFTNLERLNKSVEKFINERKDRNATFILSIYKQLAIKASEVSYIGVGRENPILNNISGNLFNLLKNGMDKKNLEVVYQGINVIKTIAHVASANGSEAVLYGLYDKLFKIGEYGVIQKQQIIVQEINKVFIEIIGFVFVSKKIIAEHHFSSLVKYPAKISSLVDMAMKTKHLPNDFTSSSSLDYFYSNLYLKIAIIYNLHNDMEEEEASIIQSRMIKFMRDLYMSLRNMADETIDCNKVLIGSIHRMLYDLNLLMMRLSVREDVHVKKKKEFIKRLISNIHLSSFFVSNLQIIDIDNQFRYIVNYLTRLGIILSIELKNKELFKACVETLDEISNQIFLRGERSRGYDEARYYKNICYLGVCALSLGWEEEFIDIQIKILEFESKYANKFFKDKDGVINKTRKNPSYNQLEKEMMSYSYDFQNNQLNRMSLLREDGASLIYLKVEARCIDWFTFRIWNSWNECGAGNEEIEKYLAKQKIIKSLKLLLRNKSSM